MGRPARRVFKTGRLQDFVKLIDKLGGGTPGVGRHQTRYPNNGGKDLSFGQKSARRREEDDQNGLQDGTTAIGTAVGQMRNPGPPRSMRGFFRTQRHQKRKWHFRFSGKNNLQELMRSVNADSILDLFGIDKDKQQRNPRLWRPRR